MTILKKGSGFLPTADQLTSGSSGWVYALIIMAYIPCIPIALEPRVMTKVLSEYTENITKIHA